jgi:hypothetical protein
MEAQMSIQSLSTLAIARRDDMPSKAPGTAREVAQTLSATDANTDTTITAALRTVTAYIPTEVLTVYLAVVGALATTGTAGTTLLDPNMTRWVLFWLFVVLTPATVWLTYAAKVQAAGKPLPILRHWPVWEISAATIAFVIWAFTLPGTPFSSLGWYTPSLGSVAILVGSLLMGLVGPLFTQRPIKTGSPQVGAPQIASGRQ